VRAADVAPAAATRTVFSMGAPAAKAADGLLAAWSVTVAKDVAPAKSVMTAWSVKGPVRKAADDGFYTRRPSLTTT
jgi:hypothetical protein